MRLMSILLVVAVCISAAEAASINDCTLISSPGYYSLSKSILNTATKPCINITASNVTLEGNGYTVDGVDSGSGVYIYNSSGIKSITIRNLTLTDWSYGVYIYNATNISLENLTMKSGGDGAHIRNSSNISIANVEVSNNGGYGIYIFDNSSNITLSDSIFTSNNEGLNAIKVKNIKISNTTIYNNVHDGMEFQYSENITIASSNSSNNGVGIYLYYSNGSVIYNTVASNNGEGISLFESAYNSIYNNTLTENGEKDLDFSVATGSYHPYVCNNLIENNTGSGNRDILYYNTSVNLSNTTIAELILCNATNSNIVNVTVMGSDSKKNNGLFGFFVNRSNLTNVNSSGNYQGIYLYASNNNTIRGATTVGSELEGIYLHYSSYNTLRDSTAGNSNWKAIVEVWQSSSNLLVNNTVFGTGYYGIRVGWGGNNILENNTVANISGDEGWSGGYGIDLTTSDGNTLRNNTVTRSYSSGIRLDAGSDTNTLIDNTVERSGDRGIYITSSSDGNKIYSSIIRKNDYGVYIYSSDSTEVIGNTISENTYYGVWMGDSRYNTIKNNLIQENGVNYEEGKDLYITFYWQGASYCSNTIQNNTGSGNRSILYYDYGVNIGNLTVSELVLCNADRSNVTNVTVLGSSRKNNGILVQYTENATFRNINSSGNALGISLIESTNNTIVNSSFNSNRKYGVYLEKSHNNTINTSSADGNGYDGIHLYKSKHNSIYNNTARGNYYYDIDLYLSSTDYCDNLIENITGTGNLPVLFYNTSVNLSNATIAELILCNADNSNITDVNVRSSSKNNGILAYYTDSATFRNVNSSHNYVGMDLDDSNNNLIEDSTFSYNKHNGIYLDSSSDNTITRVKVVNNTDAGIHLDSFCDRNTISNSTISKNDDGIWMMSWSSNNLIIHNNITENSLGLRIFASGNSIYNNLFNNTDNAVADDWERNYWNTTKQAGVNIINGSYLGGNAWLKPQGNGFSETCNDTDKDGICDSSYQLAEENVDYLPLKYTKVVKPPVNITNCTTINSSGYYVLTQDIINASLGGWDRGCINITASNVVFDGDGHLIDGIREVNYGITVENAESVTIRDVRVRDFLSGGIKFENVNNSRIENSVLRDYGKIYLRQANSNNTIINTNVINGSYGIYIRYSRGTSIINSSVINTTTGVSIYYSNETSIYNLTTTGRATGSGIDSTEAHNNTIANSTIRNFSMCIDFTKSNNNTVTESTLSECQSNDISGAQNTITSSYVAGVVELWGDGGHAITGNTITEGLYIGVTAKGNYPAGNNISNNTVNGKPLVYLENARNQAVKDAGQVIVVNSSNVTAKGLNLSDIYVGVQLIRTVNSTVSGNTINNVKYGIYLSGGSSNNLAGNTIENATNEGIELRDSATDVTIFNNTIRRSSSDTYAYANIYISGSNSNTIAQNTLIDGMGHAIRLYYADTNVIANNTIINNSGTAFYLDTSNSNLIYNNFVNSSEHVYLPSSTGYWNTSKQAGVNIINGSYLGGNYWAYPNGTGFSESCSDANRDGICDSPYVLNANNADYLPLTYPPPQPPVNITNCTTINSSGRYVLQNNLSSTSTCINITASNVLLEGNGHVIDGTDAYNTFGIYIHGSYLTNVTLRNLTLTDWDYGIYALNSTITAEHITAVSNSYGAYLYSSPNSTIANSTFTGNSYGLYMSRSENSVVSGNYIAQSVNNGVEVSKSGGSVFTHNTLYNNSLSGIYLDSSNATVFSHNNLTSNKNGILSLDSSHVNITHNLAQENNNNGIKTRGSHNLIENNTLIENVDGIEVEYSSFTTVRNNTLINNTYSGIWVVTASENNTVERNLIRNSETGMYIASDSNTIEYNTVESSAEECILVSGDYNSVENNTLSSCGQGIYVSHSVKNTVLKNRIEKAEDALVVSFSTGTTFANNTLIDTSRHHINFYGNSTTCANTFENNTDDGRVAAFYSGAVNLSGKNLSQLVLCNSSYSLISNTTIAGTGLLMLFTDFSGFENLSISAGYMGVEAYYSDNNTFRSFEIGGAEYGFYLKKSYNNTLTGSRVISSTYGVYLNESRQNLIYNNFFNTTQGKPGIEGYSPAYWNTSKQAGVNIINGSYLGGNFWAKPDGTGFSETCGDADNDSICDSAFVINPDNTDYLPLTYPGQAKLAGTPLDNCTKISSSGYYYLTTDIVNVTNSTSVCVNITASDVVLDGKGHVIAGLNQEDSMGIYAGNVKNISIRGIAVRNFPDGIVLRNVNSSRIESCRVSNITGYYYNGAVYIKGYNNTLKSCVIGNNSVADVELSGGGNYTVVENNLTNGIYLPSTAYNNIMHNNTVGGEPIVYMENVNNTVVREGAQVILVGCSNVTVEDLNLSGVYAGVELLSVVNATVKNVTINRPMEDGVYLYKSSTSTISGNTIISSEDNGISVWHGTNNIVAGNTITSSKYDGISVWYGINNIIAENTVTGGGDGVSIISGSGNTVSGNTLRENSNGVDLWLTENNTVVNNTVTDCTSDCLSFDSSANNTLTGNRIINSSSYAFNFWSSSNNLIYNNFINTTKHFYAWGTVSNLWNTTKQAGVNIVGGSIIGGNYWATPQGTGFSETCKDANNDSICDSAYNLTADWKNVDYLPLAAAVKDTTPPSITFVAPTPANGSAVNVSYVYINVTANEPLSTALLEWNGSNLSMQKGSWHLNLTNLSNGLYTYRVWGRDLAGNWNKTEARVVVVNVTAPVDRTPPVITLHSPQNRSYNTSSIPIEVSANEVISAWWYSLDSGANTSFTPNTTLSGLSDGLHRLIVYANDSAGNVGYASVVFTIDTTPPALKLSIANNTYIEERGGVNLTLTSNENLSRAWVSVSGAKSLKANLSGSGKSWHANLSLPQGRYSLVAHAVDAAGNENTALVSFYVVGLSGQNATNISANATKAIINTTDVVVEANATGNTTLNLSVAVASFSIGVQELNRTTTLKKADKGVKYIEIKNNTAVQNISGIRVEIHFTKAEIGNLDPDTLALFYWNGTAWISTFDYKNRTIPDAQGGLFVYDAGRDYNPATGKGYVYAVVNHTSVFGLGGSVAAAPAAAALAPAAGVYSPEAVLLANSIDLALAKELIEELEGMGIKLYIVNAKNFTEYAKKSYKIILGGHKAYEGVGEIVADITTSEERKEIEKDKAFLKKKSVFRAGGVVYIFAGRDRNATVQAWKQNITKVAKEIKFNLR